MVAGGTSVEHVCGHSVGSIATWRNIGGASMWPAEAIMKHERRRGGASMTHRCSLDVAWVAPWWSLGGANVEFVWACVEPWCNLCGASAELKFNLRGGSVDPG